MILFISIGVIALLGNVVSFLAGWWCCRVSLAGQLSALEVIREKIKKKKTQPKSKAIQEAFAKIAR
tara:strand:+ start:113 stop:310 length:198 start_codon:yes stop_codon:yes gene_type:complete